MNKSDRSSLYKDHLRQKSDKTSQLLRKTGCEHLFDGIVPTPVETGYRSRAKFRIYSKMEAENVRIYGRDPIQGEVPFEQSLWILPEWGRRITRILADLFAREHRSFPVDGFELQLAHGQQKAHVLLSVNKKHKLSFSGLAKEMVDLIPEISGVAIPSQKAEFGEAEIEHIINNKKIFAHYNAFFQSNLRLTPRILDEYQNFTQGKKIFRVLDLYCGVGLFSLLLNNPPGEILGIEINREAVESAKKNAARSGLLHTEFICGPVEKWVHQFKQDSFDLAIINPPRSGCPEKVISLVAKMKVQEICLVSCYLETHIMDLKIWQKCGWKVSSLKAFDMFPFTEFLETMTFIRSK